jgi:hypothetical protein
MQNKLTITMSLEGKPVPNQTVNYEQTRPDIGSGTGEWTAGADGTVIAYPFLATMQGTITVTLSWLAPDGVTRTVMTSAEWVASKPAPPKPTPPQDWQVVIGPFDTEAQAQDAASAVTKQFKWVPKIEVVTR